ncbi:MAG: DUF5655 domain-containing protein [Myxococcaceae bacterium]
MTNLLPAAPSAESPRAQSPAVVNAAPPELAPEIAPPPPKVLKPEELLALQFQGPKAALRPVFDAVSFLVKRVGPGSKTVPLANLIVFARKGIPFAAVKVANPTKLELALALPEMRPVMRWKKSSRFAGVPRLTHRCELNGLTDVDGELVQWVKAAFERAKPAPPPKTAAAPSPAALVARRRRGEVKLEAGSS